MSLLESEFQRDITAPFRSFRLLAYEKAMRFSQSKEILEMLNERLPLEDDNECRSLLYMAVETIQKRLQGIESPPQEGTFEDQFLDDFPNSKSSKKIELLTNLIPEQISRVAHQAPDFLEAETDPIVSATIIRTFSSFWPSERLQSLVSRLISDRLCIQIAALESLAEISPALLIRDLPKFLTSYDPRLRAVAIWGLSKVDEDEALGHLDLLLMASEPTLKMAALQNFFLLPFEKVKPMLLKFFAVEMDNSILDEAGNLFQINPDPEVPFRLWEIIERSPQKKAGVLKDIFSGACKALETSGILGEGYPNYVDHLQKWVNQRAAISLVQEFIVSFSQLDNSHDPERETVIEESLENPIIREAFLQALDWSIPNNVKEKIRELLGIDSSKKNISTPDKSQANPPDSQSTEREKMTPDEKIRGMASWRQKDSKELQPRFDEIFNSSKSPPALKAMALRTAKRLEIPGFSESCERFLKDSNVPLVTAALEYLGRFEPDKIFPILGKFLQAPDPWLKSAALRLIQQYDPSQAISALSAMLLGKNPRHFAPALACTVYFDFSLVRGIISDFLATNPDRNLLESGLCLFQANPDPENLFALFQIEEKLPCESAQSVKLVRRQCEAFLVSAGLLKPGQSEKHQEEFTQRSAQKKAKKSATPAPYSVAGLKTARIEPGRKFLSGVTSEFMVQSGVVCLSLFGLGLLFWFVAFSSSETSNKGSHSRKALSTVANVIKGQVTEKNGDDIVIISQEGEKYILISDSGWSADLQPGNLVLAEVIPYRSSFDGAIIANPKSIKILEESR